MGTSAGTVTADFDARSAKFAAELAKVQKGLGALQKEIRGVQDFLKSTGSLIAGAFSVGAIAGFVKSAGDAQVKLLETAQAAGVSTTSLKALQLVTRETGGSVEGLTNALFTAQKNLGLAAAGTGEARKFINALGLDVEQLRRLSPDELFLTYSDAIGKLGTQSEQVAAAQALFGKGATQVLNTIRAGRPAFEEAAAAVRQLGLALEPEQVATIDAAGDAIDRVRDTAQAFGARIAASISPFVTDFANRLLDTAVGAGEAQSGIDKFVDGAYTGLQIVLNAVNVLRAGFFGLAAGIAKVGELVTFGGLSESLQASVDANLAKAENALQAVKSFTQINADIQRIRETAEQQARDSLPSQFGASGGAIDLDLSGDTFDPLKGLNVAEAVDQQLRAEQEQRLATIIEYGEREMELRRNLADRQKDLAAEVSAFEIEQRAAVVNAAVGLLNLLGGKSKTAAAAAILVSRALAIAQVIQNTAVAVMKTMAIYGPTPQGFAAAAGIKTMGAVQIGLIAATGALEISNTLSGDRGGIGNTGLGTPTNPLPVTNAGGMAESRAVTQIYFNGPVAGEQAFIDLIKDAIGDDVVVIPYSSAQAAVIRGE